MLRRAEQPARRPRRAWAATAAICGCTASAKEPPPAPTTAPEPPSVAAEPKPAPPVAAEREPAPPVARPVESPPGVAPAENGPLAHFYEALHGLEDGGDEHVRILWMGDSHAQADFWTDHIREGLQKRFGNAGPGFVHLGMRGYRHADVDLDIGGKWRMRPKAPSTMEPWGDGAFGLGGVLNAGFAGRRAAVLKLEDASLAGERLRWDICYKHGRPQDRFRLTLGSREPEEIAASGPEDVGEIRHLVRHTEGPATLKVSIAEGRPDFCGVVIETEEPGVVLDNIGINGARYATPLAWDEEAWAAEVRLREPDLFIFEYGGNEASDMTSVPAQFKAQALALIARTERIRPEASCLVIGPADRADLESRMPPIVAAIEEAAAESGCMFWNTYEVMGGRGSLRTWRATKRAAEDGIHLNRNGYAELGALLLADLMAEYRR